MKQTNAVSGYADIRSIMNFLWSVIPVLNHGLQTNFMMIAVIEILLLYKGNLIQIDPLRWSFSLTFGVQTASFNLKGRKIFVYTTYISKNFWHSPKQVAYLNNMSWNQYFCTKLPVSFIMKLKKFKNNKVINCGSCQYLLNFLLDLCKPDKLFC